MLNVNVCEGTTGNNPPLIELFMLCSIKSSLRATDGATILDVDFYDFVCYNIDIFGT